MKNLKLLNYLLSKGNRWQKYELDRIYWSDPRKVAKAVLKVSGIKKDFIWPENKDDLEFYFDLNTYKFGGNFIYKLKAMKINNENVWTLFFRIQESAEMVI